MSTATPTWHTLDTEGHSVSWSTASRTWEHDDAAEATHDITPELRFAIDATCPSCGFPEIGCAPERKVFTCSRCLHEQTERPAS